MSFVNYKRKEINCKIVYAGPPMGGKTTNIQHIYKKTSGVEKTELMRINSENDRTLFFDFLPLDVGFMGDFKVRFHLYSVPGQSFYETSRKTILRGVDAVVFVADSRADKMEENIASYLELEKLLTENFIDTHELPIIFQWNKRDLPNTASLFDLEKLINKREQKSFEATATHGIGVLETLQAVTEALMIKLKSLSLS